MKNYSAMWKNLFFSLLVMAGFVIFASSSAHAQQYTETTMSNNQNQNWNQNMQNYQGSNDSGWNYNQRGYPTIVHGMAPQVRSGQDMYNVQTGQMTGVSVYSQNVSPTAFTTTICAQQWSNGQMYHLGCVPEAPFTNATDGPSRFDFNVWPVNNMPGNQSMTFTYRDMNGNWKPILSPTYQSQQVSIGT